MSEPMTEHTPTPWNIGISDNGRADWVFASGQAIADCEFINDKGVTEANAAFIVKAVNNHDALVKALEQCAASFSTAPGSVAQCQSEIGAEFQRRMDIAGDALAVVGSGEQP
jgi:hypothetical protein